MFVASWWASVMHLTGVNQLVNTPLNRICIFYELPCLKCCRDTEVDIKTFHERLMTCALGLQVGTCLILDVQLEWPTRTLHVPMLLGFLGIQLRVQLVQNSYLRFYVDYFYVRYVNCFRRSLSFSFAIIRFFLQMTLFICWFHVGTIYIKN